MQRSEEILAALKSGEENAFKEFFMEYHDILVLFATHILKNVDAAEDVVQECFMNIWENSLFNRLSNGLDKYMFQLVKNAALNDLRGSKRREARHEKAMTELPLSEELPKDDDQIELLYATINQLPPERRRIFMMICAEGKKYQDVADQLQISINTVRTQMVRSLKFLREKLKDQMFSILLFCWERVRKRKFNNNSDKY